MLSPAILISSMLFGLLQISLVDPVSSVHDHVHIAETWRPLRERERPMISRVVIPMRQAIPFGNNRAESHATKKRLQVEPSSSNKIEVFAPAPPSILGSFSDFGHATVKAREPARMKKKPPVHSHAHAHAEQHTAEASPAIGLLLPPPPVHENEANFGFQHDETPAAAYYFEASLRPPPRDSAINVISPPHSSNLPPNTYYFDNPQNYHSRFPVTNPHNRHQNPQQSDFFFGQSTSAFRTTLPTVPPYEATYHIYESDAYDHASTRLQPPAAGPATTYYNQNPFGDINLSSRRPEFKPQEKQHSKDIFHHLSHLRRPNHEENKNKGKEVYHQLSHSQRPIFDENQNQPVAKDVFQQLSHLGRPFKNPQSSPTDQNRFNNNVNHNNNQHQKNPYLTTVSSSIQFGDDKRVKIPSQSFHIPPTAPDAHQQGNSYDSNSPYSRKVIPLSVTTLDIPSDTVKTGTVLSTVQPYSEFYDQKHKPLTYNDAPIRNRRPQVDIKTYQSLRDDLRPFLPTPATDVEPFIKEPIRENPLSAPEDQLNEVHVPNRGTYSAIKKPTDETPSDDPTTTFYKVSSRKPSNSLKHRRRRPTEAHSTASSVLQEYEQANGFNSIQDGVYTNVGNVLSSSEPHTESEQENYPVTTPQPQKKRKKPSRHRNRVHSNFKSTLPPEPETTHHVLYDYSTAVITDQPELINPHTHVSADIYSNTQPIEDYTRYKDYSTQDSIAGTQNIYPTQPVSIETANSIEEEEATEALITTTLAPTTTSTTTTQAPLPSSTASYRTRVRNKYGNNTRPRFSVKEYKERINRGSSTTTIAPSAPEETETETPKVRVKYPTRNRGHYKASSSTASVVDDDLIQETTTEIIRKYKPRVRYSYKTSTTTSKPTLQLDSPTTTTERVNTFKPNGSRYKSGSGKYYSRYRTTTTKAPEEENDDSSPSASDSPKLIRTKGVFSAKRRPFPLRTRVENDESRLVTEESRREIEQALTTVMTKKVDDATTTVVSGTVQTIVGPTGEEAYTVQRVSDLTSSPSNMYQPNGFRKGLSPASRRTVPQITIATDDPILPLEAFFQTWSNNKEKRNTR